MAIIWDSQKQSNPNIIWSGGGQQQAPQSTDMFEQAGMTFSPEDAAAHPYANAINKTGRDVYAMAYPYVNQLLSNNPRAALEKQGLEAPKVSQNEPYTDVAQAVQNIGGVAGMVQNPLNRLAASNSILSKAGFVKSALTGALAGGAQGTVNPEDRITNAALGAGLNVGAEGANKAIGNIRKYVVNAVPFLEHVQSAFAKAKDIATTKFGAALDHLQTVNPNKAVDLTPIVDEVRKTGSLNPKVLYLAENNPAFKAMLDTPSLAKGVPLKESQDLVNSLKAVLPKGVLSGANVDALDLPIYKFLDTIKAAQDSAFPEMKAVRSSYESYKDKVDSVGNAIASGSSKGDKSLEGALQNKFHSKLVNKKANEILKEVEDWSPEHANVRKDIISYRRTNKAIKYGPILGGTTAAGAALNWGVRRGLSNLQGNQGH